MLIEHEKKFLIVGNPNAITYKEFFPLLKENKVWIGYKAMGTDMYFDVSKEHEKELRDTKREWSGYRIIDNHFCARAPAIWYTNLDIDKRHKKIDLVQKYSSDKYPKYDCYDAIEVSKVANIPYDYDGIMGVPISFMDKYNPEQFEIIGEANHGIDNDYDLFKPTINGTQIFKRILIRNKNIA